MARAHPAWRCRRWRLVLILGTVAQAGARAPQIEAVQGPLLQWVSPGESVQAAVNRVGEGGTIVVEPGVYRETADAVNGLVITRSVHLIGLAAPGRRVVLENAGLQRNGIVAVPRDRANCMQCHTSLAPPFPLSPGVQRGIKLRDPTIRGLSVRGITMRGFENNGLLSRNGFISRSRVLAKNGTNPLPGPFAFAAADLALLSFGAGNCYAKNDFATGFSLTGVLPPRRGSRP